MIQTAHVGELSPLQSDLVEVLEKHCGERLNGLLSINQDEAIPAIAVLLMQLCAARADAEEIIDAIKTSTLAARAKFLAQQSIAGSA